MALAVLLGSADVSRSVRLPVIVTLYFTGRCILVVSFDSCRAEPSVQQNGCTLGNERRKVGEAWGQTVQSKTAHKQAHRGTKAHALHQKKELGRGPVLCRLVGPTFNPNCMHWHASAAQRSVVQRIATGSAQCCPKWFLCPFRSLILLGKAARCHQLSQPRTRQPRLQLIVLRQQPGRQ